MTQVQTPNSKIGTKTDTSQQTLSITTRQAVDFAFYTLSYPYKDEDIRGRMCACFLPGVLR